MGSILLICCSPVSAQNHNPFFEVSDVHIGGNDYVLVPPDVNSNSIQTSVDINYRNNDIPSDGSTVLSEAGNVDVSVYEGGSLLSPMPHTWSDDDQGNKTLGLQATYDAALGTTKELSVSYTPPEGESSPINEKEFTMLKLDLITPAGDENNDPVNNPIAVGNDGANEFTFSSASPGVLTIQFKAGATGISDMNDIVDKVSFSIDNVGQVPTWSNGNGGQASVSGNYLVATATFTGLPASNSQLGEKTVKLLYDGDVVEEKIIEVFFPRDADNHPGGNQTPSGGGSSRAPNWFHYWNDALGGTNVLYNDNLKAFVRGIGDAYAMTPAMYLWSSSMNYSKTEIWMSEKSLYSIVRQDGSQQSISGIHTFANLLKHEEKHIDQIALADSLLGNLNGQAGTVFEKGWSWPPNSNQFTHNHYTLGFGDKPGEPNVNDDGDSTTDELTDLSEIDHVSTDDVLLDTDWDNVPDAWEPTLATTFDLIEDQAYAEETISNNDDAYLKLDWGDPGKQHETLGEHSD